MVKSLHYYCLILAYYYRKMAALLTINTFAITHYYFCNYIIFTYYYGSIITHDNSNKPSLHIFTSLNSPGPSTIGYNWFKFIITYY